jgi:hypothetical protein
VIAKIDFTTKKRSYMPSRDEVREFNLAVERFFRKVERRFRISRREYGVIWCDEFGGSNNTNLHAHGLYAGPWLENKHRELSDLWQAACRGTSFEGSFIVSIKPAKSFEAGLAHALKYTGKILSRDPKRLAALELSFHGARRVHALARFYNATGKREGGGHSEPTLGCPLCGAALERVGGWQPIAMLVEQGCQELFTARQRAGRDRILRAPPVSTV